MKVTLNWLKQYVDFNWSPEELAERLTKPGLAIPATEWRKPVAHGVSRGLGVLFGTSPGGAAENPRSSIHSLSPLRGLNRFKFIPTARAVGYPLTPFHG